MATAIIYRATLGTEGHELESCPDPDDTLDDPSGFANVVPYDDKHARARDESWIDQLWRVLAAV